jgi:hypothetical protein
MAGLKPPSPLDIDNKTTKVYSEWLRAYEIFSIATGVDEKDEKIQCNVFLHVAGEAAQKVYATFTFAEGEVNKIGPLFAKAKRKLLSLDTILIGVTKDKVRHLTHF